MFIINRLTIFFIISVIFLSCTLFYLKYLVVSIEDDIKITKLEIIKEKETFHILKAEWKNLTNPERIKNLADRYLTKTIISPSQIYQFDKQIFCLEDSKQCQFSTLVELVNSTLNDTN